MAFVARGHGGDAGGEPPPGPWRPPPFVDRDPKVRGKSRSQKLRDAFSKNGERPLPIMFDTNDLQTVRPVGPNASSFTNLIGLEVQDVPKYYSEWKKVPEDAKSHIWPQIETYFDMTPHLSGPHAKRIIVGVDKICADRYSDRKYHFKKDAFTAREGFEHPQEIRAYPPPNMPSAEWNTYVDFVTQPKRKKQAESNAANRRQQLYPSKHGSRSYAAIRQKQFEEKGSYPSLIDNFGTMHRGTVSGYVNEAAKEHHEEMEQLKATQSATQSATPSATESVTVEMQILKQVLGERRGHIRGVGRKLPIASTSTAQSQGRTYTQSEVDEMLASTQQLLANTQEELANTKRKVNVQGSQNAAILKTLRTYNMIVNDYPEDDEHSAMNENEENEEDEESE